MKPLNKYLVNKHIKTNGPIAKYIDAEQLTIPAQVFAFDEEFDSFDFTIKKNFTDFVRGKLGEVIVLNFTKESENNIVIVTRIWHEADKDYNFSISIDKSLLDTAQSATDIERGKATLARFLDQGYANKGLNKSEQMEQFWSFWRDEITMFKFDDYNG